MLYYSWKYMYLLPIYLRQSWAHITVDDFSPSLSVVIPLTPPPSSCVQVSSSFSPLKSPRLPHTGPSCGSHIRPHLLSAAPCATSSSAQSRLTPILRAERGWGKPSCRDRSLNSQNWEPVCQTRRFFTLAFIQFISEAIQDSILHWHNCNPPLMKMMAWSDSLSSTAWMRGRSGGRPLHSLRTEVPRGDTKPAALTRHIVWPESIRRRGKLMYWKWGCVCSQSQQVVLQYWRLVFEFGFSVGPPFRDLWGVVWSFVWDLRNWTFLIKLDLGLHHVFWGFFFFISVVLVMSVSSWQQQHQPTSELLVNPNLWRRKSLHGSSPQHQNWCYSDLLRHCQGWKHNETAVAILTCLEPMCSSLLLCPEHLPKESSRRLPKYMPEPPQLAHLVEEQWLYYKHLLRDPATYHELLTLW